MKAIIVFLVACAVLSACARPTLPHTFTAKVNLQSKSHHGYGSDTGVGIWAVDEDSQSSVESFTYTKGIFDSFSLNRFDSGKLYRVYSANSSRCDQFPVEEQMSNVWAWIEKAEFAEHKLYQDKSVDVWQLNVGYGTRRLAVWSHDTSIPAWQDFHGGERDTLIEFVSFSATAPDVAVFAVPAVCQAPQNPPAKNNVGCMASATIMANAEIWVAHNVPYNTGGTYMNYREDCSGYVSFCWQSGPPGHDTSSFYQVSHPITKAELTPGDCMLFAGEHVCLFDWAYEETQPCSDNPNWCNTRKDDVSYPYYYDPSSFLPYRYNNFC